MKKEIAEFNNLLKRNESSAIVNIEDRTEWVIEPKETGEQFIDAIEAAVNNMYEGGCEVRKAKLFDSGYSMEIGLRLRVDDSDSKIEIYLYHATKF